MPGYCSQCGNPLADGSNFCPSCGAKTASPSVGYSDRVRDPEILAAMKKNKKAAAIFAVLFIPLPLIGFTLYSRMSDKMEPLDGIRYGAIISAVFLFFALISAIRKGTSKSYDAVVTGKTTRERSENKSDDTRYYTEYITYVKTADGKKKKIVEREGSMVTAYHYLNIGDRFRYHPQFYFPYELYDKTNAPYIACVSCGTKNDTHSDRCSKCHLPLLK